MAQEITKRLVDPNVNVWRQKILKDYDPYMIAWSLVRFTAEPEVNKLLSNGVQQ